MGNQVASIEIQAKSAGLSAQLREARAKFGTFADEVAQGFIDKAAKAKGKGKGLFGIGGKKGIGGSIGDMVGVAGGNLLGAGIGKVAGEVTDIAKSTFDYNRELVRLQILSDQTPAQMDAFSASVRKASDATGINKDEILKAGSTYVALTGDMDTAAKSIDVWTKVAQATGSSTSDISQAAAALSQQMNIKPDQMLETFGVLAYQGKKGAIEIKDLAEQLSTIAPKWARFGGATGQGARGVAELGAALQIAKRGFGGDAGQTVTGLESMLASFQRHAKKFGDHGIKIFESDGRTMRNVSAIVGDIAKKNLRGDLKIEMFGRTEGLAAEEQLERFSKEYQDLASTSGGAAMIQRDLATFMDSAAGKTDRAFTKLKNTIAEAFTPERIEMFANGLERAAAFGEKAVHFAMWLTGNGSKEEGANAGTSYLLDRQREDSVGGDANAIARANQILQLKEMPDASMGNEAIRSEIGKAGGLENAKAGAQQFLKSYTNARGQAPTSANPYIATAELGFLNTAPGAHRGTTSSKDVTDAIAKGFAQVASQMHLTIDGGSVQKATKAAPIHRTGNTGR